MGDGGSFSPPYRPLVQPRSKSRYILGLRLSPPRARRHSTSQPLTDSDRQTTTTHQTPREHARWACIHPAYHASNHS
eukprot:2952532-Prymnesium_polylepis.2